jgi:hypothetical protein
MKSFFHLFLFLFLIHSMNACELPDDPFHGLTLDQDAKENRLKSLRAVFNELHPSCQSTDFEERVKAIEDVNHPLRRRPGRLAQAYIALRLEGDEVDVVGMISSMRQFYKVLGPNYQNILTSSHYVVLKHFKYARLADGELIDVGALLLGTNDVRIMLEVIKHDLKNDYIEMTQKAYKGIIDE